jgi:hypothetical protein
MEPWLWVGIGVGVIGLVLTGYLLMRHRRPRSGKEALDRILGGPLPTPVNQPAVSGALRQNLLLKCGHNQELTNRLIADERARLPNGTELEWTQAAIDRWERDNR